MERANVCVTDLKPDNEKAINQAADILNRVMTAGLVERKPADVKRQVKALRKAIKRMESE